MTDATRRAIRCSCGGTIYLPTEDNSGRPTWECGNCWTVTPRQTRVSAKRRRVADWIARNVREGT